MNQTSPRHRILRFGVFECDLCAGELHKNGIKVKLSEQPFRLLTILLERPGEVVTRQELREQLWPDQPYSDLTDSLNTAVNKVRAALSDEAENPHFIETLPRRGYRFIGEVAEDAHAPPAASEVNVQLKSASSQVRPAAFRTLKRTGAVVALSLILGLATYFGLSARSSRARKSTGRQIRSLAVLPFEDVSPGAHEAYFSDGITDELTTDLAQIGSVRVTSRTSTLQYQGTKKSAPQIGRELGVDAIVEGSVARDGTRVRINAQLIDSSNDRHIWAQSFESDANNIVVLQDNVARAVAETIETVLQPAERARLASASEVNVQAYDAYLRGLYALNRRSQQEFTEALKYFQQSASLDPTFGPAYSGLAQTYDLEADYELTSEDEAYPKAEAAAQNALHLDNSLGAAHAALGFALWHHEWDWNTAQIEFQRALALNPNDATLHHWYAVFLTMKGDFPASRQEIEIARELDPLSFIIKVNIGWLNYYQHDLPAAEAQLRKAIQENPGSMNPHQKLWIVLACEGNRAATIQELEKVIQISGQSGLEPQIQKTNYEDNYRAALRAYSDFISRVAGSEGYYEQARIFACLGDKESALKWLRKAESIHSGWMTNAGVEPAFDFMRSDPEFQSLLSRVHFPAKAST